MRGLLILLGLLLTTTVAAREPPPKNVAAQSRKAPADAVQPASQKAVGRDSKLIAFAVLVATVTTAAVIAIAWSER